MLPIILVFPDKTIVSRMILGIPSLIVQIAYKDIDDLQNNLNELLANIRPLLEARKMAFQKYRVNVVGQKIQEVRQAAKLTREDVSRAVGHLSAGELRDIEEKTDLESNPSLLQLRQIATVLKTSVAELVEPNLQQQILAMLNNWVADREFARTFISEADRKRILKTVLRRLADDLDA